MIENYIERQYDRSVSRIYKLIYAARQEAEKSDCNYRMGAVITRGNVIYSKGYNQTRSYFLGRTDMCMHAEMSAVNNFINRYVRRNPKLMSELRHYTVWCVRIPGEQSQHDMGNIYHSMPCNICLQRLRHYGFGKIVFTDHRGELRMWKLHLKISRELTSYYTRTII